MILWSSVVWLEYQDGRGIGMVSISQTKLSQAIRARVVSLGLSSKCSEARNMEGYDGDDTALLHPNVYARLYHHRLIYQLGIAIPL